MAAAAAMDSMLFDVRPRQLMSSECAGIFRAEAIVFISREELQEAWFLTVYDVKMLRC